MLLLVALFLVNVVIGVVVWVDVTRRGRSWWWLVAVKYATVPALIAYVVTRRQESTRPGKK